MKQRGEVLTVVLLVLALAGGGLMVFKPKWLHGESKRAKASVVATEKVEQTVAKVDAAVDQRGANAAAKVATIGIANSMAPDSPAKTFIEQEYRSALLDLPKPDPEALLEAEKRRSAAFKGQLELMETLYAKESARALKLNETATAAVQQRDIAFKQRQAADEALSVAAADHLAQERMTNLLIVVAVVLTGGWIWTKFTHVSPAGLTRMALDIRKGEDPIVAMDTVTPMWVQDAVRKSVQLKTPLPPTNPNPPSVP